MAVYPGLDPYTVQKLTEYLQLLSQAAGQAGGAPEDEMTDEERARDVVRITGGVKLRMDVARPSEGPAAGAHPTYGKVKSFATGLAAGVGKSLAEWASLGVGLLEGLTTIPTRRLLEVQRQTAKISRKAKEERRRKFEEPLRKLVESKPHEKITRAYEKHVEKPLEKSAPSKTAFAWGKEIGEWVAPQEIAHRLVGAAFPGARVALTIGVPLLERVAPVLLRSVSEAAVAVTAHNLPKPREERAPLGKEVLYWAGTDILFRGLGRGLRLLGRALRRSRELPSDDVLKRVLEEARIEERSVKGALEEVVPEAPAAEEAAKVVGEAPVKPPERHAEKPPSTGTVKKLAVPKAPKRITLADRLSRVSEEKRRLAMAVIEDFVDSPEVTQEAREALSLWRTYKTRPDALDDAARRVAAQLDAALSHPASEVEFLRRYREAVRDAILRSQRTLPRPAGELDRKARAGALRGQLPQEVEWGHGDLLEAVLSANKREIKGLVRALEESERAARERAESILRRLVEERKAERKYAEVVAREAGEAAAEHIEAPARQWPVLEETEAVPETIPQLTVRKPEVIETTRRTITENMEEEIIEAYKDACESRFAPLVDALENSSPNARRAASVIDRMKKAGYDVSDAESALEEYRSVKRSDYGDVEEFRDAKEDLYYQVVQALRDALDEGPQVESLEDLPEKFVRSELAKRKPAAAAREAPEQAGVPGPEGAAGGAPQPAAPASRVQLYPSEEALFFEWNRVRTGAVPESEVHPALAALKREYEALKQRLAELTADQERRWNEAMARIREDLEAELADLRAGRRGRKKAPEGLLKREEVIRARYAKIEAETKSKLQKQFLKEQHELRSTIYKYEQDPEFVKQRLNEAYHAARRSGEIVELHSGLHPGAVAGSLRRIFRSRNTGPTFAPVERIGNGVRSLPQSDIEKLPDAIIEIDGKRKGLVQWLEEFDTAAARLNQERHELELWYGPPQLMPPQARRRYDQIGEELRKIAEKREVLRKPVEQALDLARRGQYSKSLALRIDNAKLLPESARTIRIGGEDAFFVWVSPSGKEIKLPLTREFTKLDEEALKAGPNLLKNLWLGLPRDLFGEQVVRAFRNATYMMYHFINDYEKRLYEILKPVIKNRSALERITLLLEGNDVPRATEVEREVAAKLRKLYDELFREFGIDPNRYLKNYAPRIRERGSVWEVYQAAGRPRELQFFADFERVVKEPIFPRELNALTAGLEYIRRGAQARFLGPVLKEMEKIVSYMHPDKQRMYEEFLKAALGRPLQDERLIQGTIGGILKAFYGEIPTWARRRWVNALSQYAVHLGYLGTLAGNVMSFLKNALQQTVAIWVLDKNVATGLKYFQKAYRALATKEGQRLLDFCWVKTMREEVFLEALERRISLTTGRPEVGKVLQALEDVGFKLYGKAEKLNVSVSYMMKLLYDLERGKPLAEAIEAANKFAADTQFLYGIDSPVYWKGPIGRLFGMLTSYPLNYLRMFAELKRTDPEWVAKTANALIGGTVLMIGLSKLTGLDFYTETPAGTVLEHPVARIVRGLARGEITEELTVPMQAVRSTLLAIPAAVRLITGEATEADRKVLSEFERAVGNFVPFYVQAKRVLRFWKAAQRGWEIIDEETGKLTYRFGEVPGWEPGPTDIGARLIPEQYRSLIGPTVEQAERRAFFRQVDVAKGQQERLRDEAYQAWLEGDLRRFLQLQAELVSRGFNPLRMEDIERRLQEAEKTAAERAAEGLPEGYVPEETQAQRVLRLILGGR